MKSIPPSIGSILWAGRGDIWHWGEGNTQKMFLSLHVFWCFLLQSECLRLRFPRFGWWNFKFGLLKCWLDMLKHTFCCLNQQLLGFNISMFVASATWGCILLTPFTFCMEGAHIAAQRQQWLSRRHLGMEPMEHLPSVKIGLSPSITNGMDI